MSAAIRTFALEGVAGRSTRHQTTSGRLDKQLNDAGKCARPFSVLPVATEPRIIRSVRQAQPLQARASGLHICMAC
eukprot:4863797-Pleurochrysis_carterae.AAC.1